MEAHTASALFLWGLGAKQQPSSMMGVTVRGGETGRDHRQRTNTEANGQFCAAVGETEWQGGGG